MASDAPPGSPCEPLGPAGAPLPPERPQQADAAGALPAPSADADPSADAEKSEVPAPRSGTADGAVPRSSLPPAAGQLAPRAAESGDGFAGPLPETAGHARPLPPLQQDDPRILLRQEPGNAADASLPAPSSLPPEAGALPSPSAGPEPPIHRASPSAASPSGETPPSDDAPPKASPSNEPASNAAVQEGAGQEAAEDEAVRGEPALSPPPGQPLPPERPRAGRDAAAPQPPYGDGESTPDAVDSRPQRPLFGPGGTRQPMPPEDPARRSERAPGAIPRPPDAAQQTGPPAASTASPRSNRNTDAAPAQRARQANDSPNDGRWGNSPHPHSTPRLRRVPLPAVALTLVLLLAAVFGARAALTGTNELGIPGGSALSVLRAVCFCGLALAVGEVLAARLAHAVPDAPELPVRRWALVGTLVGAVAAATQLFVLAGTGSLAHRFATLDLIAAYTTRDGGLALLEANAFAAAAYCAGTRRMAWAPAPLLLAVVAEAFRAHPEANTPLLGSVLTLVHLTAATLWTGGLVCVLHTMYTWRRSPEPARLLLQRYTRVAALAFAAVVVTGVCSTLRRLPLDRFLDTAYGRTLLVKLVLFAAVALLALLARGRLLRRRHVDPARGPVRIELGLLAAVLVASAVLTAVPVPATG